MGLAAPYSNSMDKSESTENVTKLPASAVKIGTVSAGEAPRKQTFGSATLGVTTFVASFLGSSLVREGVASWAKENRDAYKIAANDSVWTAFKTGFKSSIDPKLWKSNLAGLVAFVGTWELGYFLVKKYEQATFKKEHPNFHVDAAQRLLEKLDRGETIPQSAENAKWQEKVQKAPEKESEIAL